jgi:hypothetical protein
VSGASVANGQTLEIKGWTSGTQVSAYLDGPIGQGQSLGTTGVDKPRPDVAQALGRSDLASSGFDAIWTVSGLNAGSHTLYVYALINGQWTSQIIPIVSPQAAAPSPTASPASSGSPTVQIESPTSGARTSGRQTFTGYAVDCATGTPPQEVRIYRGATDGRLLGTATVGTSSRDLSKVCTNGATGNAAVGWSFAVNTAEAGDGTTTYTAAADFGGRTVESSVNLNVARDSNAPSAQAINPTQGSFNNCAQTGSCLGPTYGSTYTPAYGSTYGCNPYYPSYNAAYPNNVPCGGAATTSGGCNPYYPTYNAAYPSNIPCSIPASSTATCAAYGSTGQYYNTLTTNVYPSYTSCIAGLTTTASTTATCAVYNASTGQYYNTVSGTVYASYNNCLSGTTATTATCGVYNATTGQYYNTSNGTIYASYSACLSATSASAVSGTCAVYNASTGQYYNTSTGTVYASYSACVGGTATTSSTCVVYNSSTGQYYDTATGTIYASYSACVTGTTTTASATCAVYNASTGQYYNTSTGTIYTSYNACTTPPSGTGGTCTLSNASTGQYTNSANGTIYASYVACVAGG